MTTQIQRVRRLTRDTIDMDNERSQTLMERGAVARNMCAAWPCWHGRWERPTRPASPRSRGLYAVQF